MSHAAEMLGTTQGTLPYDTDALAHCIDACFDCAQTCTACADACLAEETVAELRRCVSNDLTCGDVCVATGCALSRSVMVREAPVRLLLQACAEGVRGLRGGVRASHAAPRALPHLRRGLPRV